MLPGRDEIDRSKLNFFLAGPGRGEGLALALPQPVGGWIFVDGCKTAAGEFPLQRIWERYRVDGERVITTLQRQPAAASLPNGRASPRLNAPPVGPLDAVWAFTVDDTGHCVGLFRGERALQICTAPGVTT